MEGYAVKQSVVYPTHNRYGYKCGLCMCLMQLYTSTWKYRCVSDGCKQQYVEVSP